jgi:hypothetical protein
MEKFADKHGRLVIVQRSKRRQENLALFVAFTILPSDLHHKM